MYLKSSDATFINPDDTVTFVTVSKFIGYVLLMIAVATLFALFGLHGNHLGNCYQDLNGQKKRFFK